MPAPTPITPARLLILLLASLAGALAHAGQTGPSTRDRGTQLAPVEVTANDTRQATLAELPGAIVLTRADIDAAATTTLAGLLASVPGVTVRRRGAPGVQADIGIRGSNFKQTLILVDGVPFQSAHAGHLNSDVPIPLAAIQRIVIVRGSGALAWAGSGTGGVINIITRKGRGPRTLRAGVRGGSHGSGGVHASVAGHGARLASQLTVTASHSDSENPDQATDSDIRQVLYTGSARLGDTRLTWGAAGANKAFGAWGFYSDVYPDERENTRSRMAWLGAHLRRANWSFDARAWWQRQRDRFLTTIGSQGFLNRHRSRSIGTRIGVRRSDDHGATRLGATWRHARIRSNALGRHARRHAAIWLNRRQVLPANLVLDVGVNRAAYPHGTRHWLPAATLRWQPAPGWHSHLRWARRARLPTYTELYLQTPANQGNADLQPELSTGVEWGLRHTLARHSFTLDVYRRRTQHFIDFVRAPGETAFHADNLRELDVRGLDAVWTWRAGGRCLQTLSLGYSRLHHQLDTGAAKNSTRLPRQTLRAEAHMRMTPHLNLALHVRRPSYRRQAAATLIGARLSWVERGWQVYLIGNNLLDRRIIETGFAPIPGRWWTLGVHIAM